MSAKPSYFVFVFKQLPPRADETTSARQKEDSDGSNDYENTDSDDTDSSVQYELERIVSGPCKRGPNKGKYLIKWVGYDSDKNTWEPSAHLSAHDVREYENEIQNSSDSNEDSTPIATLVTANK